MAKNKDEQDYSAETVPAVESAPAPAAPARNKFDFNSLNTLSVVSIATALTGFGAVAGVITGHVALTQLKTDGKSGRGLAIAGLAVGYAGIAIGVFSAIARIGFGIWGARNGFDFGGPTAFGETHMGQLGDQGGMMGGFGGDQEGNFGGHMGHQDGMMGGFGGRDGNQGGIEIQPNPDVTVAPNQQNN